MSKPWKEAASVIVVARSVFSNSHLKRINVKQVMSPFQDYKTLLVKRAAKSSFMPNGYVFPGGVYHEADASRDWLELYRIMNIGSTDHMYPFAYEKDSTKLKVRTNNALSCDGNNNYLPKAFVFRITAIRELFEETGLLLAKNFKIHRIKDWFSSEWASYLHSNDILTWQERVQKNPHEFVNLCHHFKCVPDVWSLKDWSMWLTPTHLPSKRFDTTFFVAALSHIPPTEPDNKEISDLKWSTSDELLEEHRLQKLWLPPPQFYELSRIATNFEDIQSFVEFSSSWYGCERWMPLGIQTDDGWVHLLPGDEMYPKVPDFIGTGGAKKKEEVICGLKIMDLREKCSRFHRVEIRSSHNLNIIINHLPSEDHVYPKLIEV